MSRKPTIDREAILRMYAAGDTGEVIAVRLQYTLATVARVLRNGGTGPRPGTGKPTKVIPTEPEPEHKPWNEQASVNAVALLAKNGILEGPALVACVRKIETMVKEKVKSMKVKEFSDANTLRK